jgi:hypothetical protein
MPQVVKIMVAVFGAVTLLLGAVAAYLFLDARRFAASAEHAEGVVTRLVWGQPRAVYPVIRFQAASGEVEFTSSSGSYPPSYAVGDKVKVLYPPGNPRAARVESFMGLYFGAALMGVMAVAFGGVTGVVLLIFALVAKRLRQGLERATSPP